MRKIVHKYKIYKFKRFTNGLLFAIISIIALTLCLMDITDHAASPYEIILPFSVAIISMLMGFITMFHDNQSTKEKI